MNPAPTPEESPGAAPASGVAAVDAHPGRRGFFRWLTYALGTAATVLTASPLFVYILGRTRSATKDPWVPLGKLDEFRSGETRLVTFVNPLRQPWDGLTAHQGVYVRYEGKDGAGKERFRVLAANCAHLGCPVSWFPQSGLFMCPCHGGVYYATGERASGPPPRGLFACAWRVRKGQLEIEAPHYPTLQDPLVQQDLEGLAMN